MQINLNPTSERGASRDAVNRPRETLGDSHLISSDPRSRFGLVCDLLCCRGNKPTKRTWEMLQFYFQGWASLEEVQAHLEKQKLIALKSQETDGPPKKT